MTTYEEKLEIVARAWPMTTIEIKALTRCDQPQAERIFESIAAKKQQEPTAVLRAAKKRQSEEWLLVQIKDAWPITVEQIQRQLKIGKEKATLMRAKAIRIHGLDTDWRAKQFQDRRQEQFKKLDAVYAEAGKLLDNDEMVAKSGTNAHALLHWKRARGLMQTLSEKQRRRLSTPARIVALYEPKPVKPQRPQCYAPGRWFRSKGEIVPALFCVNGDNVTFFNR